MEAGSSTMEHDPSNKKIPLLRTISAEKGIAEAYNRIERDELRNRKRTFESYPREATAWLGGIGYLSDMLAHSWDLTGEDHAAQRIQVGLAGLALTASKAAFDAAMSCHYATAFASSRLGFECAFMTIALELTPALAIEWYREPTEKEFHLESPRVKTVLAAIRKESVGDNDPVKEVLGALSDLIHQTSIGTHPTKDALFPIIGEDPANPLGSQRRLLRYRKENTIRALKYGIYLNSIMIAAATPVRLDTAVPDERNAVELWQVSAEAWREQARLIDIDLHQRIHEGSSTSP